MRRIKVCSRPSVNVSLEYKYIFDFLGRASNAMSFTIEFTPSEGARKRRSLSKPIVESKAEDQWKMQSAERVHNNFIRRSLRKAGGITPETHPLTSAINAKHVESKKLSLFVVQSFSFLCCYYV